MSVRSGWLTILKHTLNPIAIRAARRGSGPFSLVEHVGRRSGKHYETPIIVAPVDAGFVAELTYGPKVSWYQNARAAGGCVVRVRPAGLWRAGLVGTAAAAAPGLPPAARRGPLTRPQR